MARKDVSAEPAGWHFQGKGLQTENLQSEQLPSAF
jgi:hypothetical protein